MRPSDSHQARLPLWKERVFRSGIALALCVYYLNYFGEFDEGEIPNASITTLLMRALSVGLIVFALAPFRRPPWWAWIILGFYAYGTASLSIAAVMHGGLNDTLFFNAVLQLPVLFALSGTRWQIDYPRCMRFVVEVLVVQLAIDPLITLAGVSLWGSMAFIGGVGNPSSFALLCSIGMTFCVFHPVAARRRWVLGGLLALGAIQTKAMFGVFAVGLILIVRVASSWRRRATEITLCLILAACTLPLLKAVDGQHEIGFLEHKLTAAAALLGLVEYDMNSSASVSQRLEMHQRTAASISDTPSGLLWGHLEGLPYWPMDSELLTYLGSFGLPFVAGLMMLHGYFTCCAWKSRKADGGFHVVALILFGFIFLTNRILDYYPIAMVYWLVVSGSMRQHSVFSRETSPHLTR